LRKRFEEIEMSEHAKVEREMVLVADPGEVWEALTDVDRLREWLGGDVELELFEGGGVSVSDDEGRRTGTVETVIERERLGFSWARPGEDPSRVEFTVEAVPAGTRLVVTETQIAGPTALAGLVWERRLFLLGRAALLVSA
jgi:uncharacterized protein YndB with AHSA1/START domain